MKCKVYEEDGYDIHTIKLNKYKTTTLNIIFRKELKKEDISFYVMLARLLTESSKKYKTKREISIELERLYSSLIYASCSLEGNSLNFEITYDFLNPKYCYDGYLEETIAFPFELLNHPNTKDGKFDSASYNICLNQFKTTIEEEKEYASSYAIKRSLENMDNTSPSSYSTIGYLEDLDKMNPASLVKAYHKLFTDFKIDIYVAGNVDMNQVVDYIRKYFKVKNNNQKLCNLYIKNKERKEVKDIVEYGDYEQATLVMIYNMINLTKRERDVVLPLFNSIFGGNELTSKLYMNVREKNSLCYNIVSFMHRFSNLLMIRAGINADNKDKCVKIINKCLREMINGDFSEEDILCAKKIRINLAKMRDDSTWSIINNQIAMDIDNALDTNKLIEEYKTVTKREIVALSKKIKSNLVYMLCKEVEDGTN